jgi:RNA polymerase sigma factor (sigma-70 family)
MAVRRNDQWVSDLRAGGADEEAVLADLRGVILAGLPYTLSTWLPSDDPRFQPLVEEVAQNTLLRVPSEPMPTGIGSNYLDTFEGRSQFTTWVHKIAVRVALTEMRRKCWENVSLDELVDNEASFSPARLVADSAPTPEIIVEGEDMLERVGRIIAEELTDKQRQAMMAVVIRGMPLEEVARRKGTNRNTLYKPMHDSRLRLKQRLEREGLTPGEVLANFERG